MSVVQWLLFCVYLVAFFAIILGYLWTIVLYVAGTKYVNRWRKAPDGIESDFLWVFLVPALNEGVTIADSVARLRKVEATNKLIMVINDGSTDDTGEVLARIAGPDLEVLTRVAPNAKKGKAAALNNAFSVVRTEMLSKERWSGFDESHVIFCIVDADGRLSTSAPAKVARHFATPQVGGVQCSVHIYNQSSFLTRVQALEFEIFGGLFQCGRAQWNAAFMGGNGQFNRMSALRSVASEEGPWSHYLTEDQELGLRLLERGWWGRHEPFTNVNQQGLNPLRPLYRQRTRWMQGNLQVLADLRRVYAHEVVGFRRFDVLFTLIQPILQVIVGLSVILSMVLWIGFGVPYLPLGNFWLTLFFLQLSVGPTVLGVSVVARGHGPAGILRVAKVLIPYVGYTWLMWPVVFKGVFSQLKGNKTWAKTDRETIKKSAPAAPSKTASG